MSEKVTSQQLANAIRFLAIDAVEKANSGHPGMPMGMADVATVLFKDFLKFNPQQADWHNRDRFVLSAGHGSMLLYALLYLTGYPTCTLDELKNFRQLGSKTAGHPEYGHLEGIETTTGPLGQGLANAVGMAIGERMMNARFGDDIFNHHIYALVGDGCLMEGISQEAISLAGHLKLSKLIILFDDNGITIDGKTSLTISEDQQKRFQAVGFETVAIDGHNHDEIAQAIQNARASDRPSLICCKTHIGFGAPNKQDSEKAHGSPLGADEVKLVRERLNWQEQAFTIPDDILQKWREIGAQHGETYQASQQKIETLSDAQQQYWQNIFTHNIAVDFIIAKLKKEWGNSEIPTVATRKSSEMVLDRLTEKLPHLVGGSADLTGSNNTKAKTQKPIHAEDFSGNYLYFGIREHAMGAIMNGLALYGGLTPYGGTFLVFSDYMRPAMRLSALMKQKVIYVLTHDSIGLGEDGPTHQPVEHLPALRAIPNLLVFRPADAVEVSESWQIALDYQGPSALILTRQNLIPLPRADMMLNLTAQGAYTIKNDDAKADITLIGTGSEVMIALEAAELLAGENITARVVSMPCMELFDKLSEEQQSEILGDCPRIAVEAAIAQGWGRYGVDEKQMLAMKSFGTSATGADAFKHFGFTAENFASKAKALLGK